MWKRWCGRTAAAPSSEALPVDLLLEIIARADVTAIVRCAATSRILRRGILDRAFRRSIMARHHGGFDRALLLGVSYRERGDVTTHRVIHTPGPTKLAARLDELSFPDPLRAVASRAGATCSSSAASRTPKALMSSCGCATHSPVMSPHSHPPVCRTRASTSCSASVTPAAPSSCSSLTRTYNSTRHSRPRAVNGAPSTRSPSPTQTNMSALTALPSSVAPSTGPVMSTPSPIGTMSSLWTSTRGRR
ncbi:putative protein TPRXL isoform X1 [Triticum dicoccoides]|uniref:putative protein TPRXL isoform X1 n=1 Tax=Triticum dicoccoides TaxID=85692 RepID=UPI00188DFE6D|nr:putative protein TPRXL isoform X1 [Triticum dicoccoides]